MVTSEDVYVTFSNEGYIKRTNKSSFARSGGELGATGVKEGDYIHRMIEVNTLENLLLFTKKGQFYLLPVHQIPEHKWKDNGTAVVNLIPLPKDDKIIRILVVKDFEGPDRSLVFVTRNGQVKRTELKEYMTTRSVAITAVKLNGQDEVVDVRESDGSKELLLVTKNGMAIRFKEQEVNPMGRVATGVRGLTLKTGDEVVSSLWVDGDEGEVIVISDKGFGKRSLLMDYPIQGRGGKGIQTFEFKDGKRVKPNGSELFKALYVKESYEIRVIISGQPETTISSERFPIEDRKSIGKGIITLGKTERIEDILTLI